MSKSKGNVIDPLEVMNGISLDELIAKLHKGNLPPKEIKRSEAVLRKEFKDGIPACGCDALRLGLVAYMRQGRNINLDLNRVVGYRQFANKIWNCTKFALDKWALDIDGQGTPFVARGIQMISKQQENTNNKSNLTLTSFSDLAWEDQWILHRLAVACDQAFSVFMAEEEGKPDLVASRIRDCRCAQEVLYTCVDQALRLLHPICPFVTEELYQRLPPSKFKEESICISSYPQPVPSWTNLALDAKMQQVQQIVGHLRSLLAALDIPPKIKPQGFVLVKDTENQISFFRDTATTMAILSKLKKLVVFYYILHFLESSS
ncbi:hypothetical protein ACSSS7_001056 [Eimeria intestinalis]